MESKKSKTGWIIGVIVVVLVIIGAVMIAKNDGYDYATNGNGPTPTTNGMDDSNNGVQVGTGTGEPGITYSQALVAYAQRRVQFSHPQGLNSCNATPQKVTFKGGTKFMLDNRMGNTAAVRFSGGVQYSLPAYSFQIVSLVTPNTYIVDCNSTTNVATVVIQK